MLLAGRNFVEEVVIKKIENIKQPSAITRSKATL
jgi:hypothetical protein